MQRDSENAEKGFARLFNAGPEAASVSKFPDHQLIEINPAFRQLFGIELHADHRGKRLSDFLPVEPILANLQPGTPVRNLEMQIQAGNGDVRHVLVWADAVDFNHETCLLTKYVDIGDRKRYEAELIYKANLLEHVSDAVIALDNEWRVTSWNRSAERIYGWSAAEVLGRPLRDFLLTEFVDRSREDIMQEFLSRGTVAYEAIQFHKDGLPIDVANSTDRLTDATGATIGAVGINRDITLFKRSQQAEREAHDLAHALAEVSLLLSERLDLPTVLGRILETVGRVVPHDAANIAFIENDMIRYVAWRGYAPELDRFFREQRVKPSLGGFSEMYMTGKPQMIRNTAAIVDWVALPDDPWVQSCLGLPIVVNGEVVGSVNLDSRNVDQFTQANIEDLSAFANYAAIAVRNAQLYAEARRHAVDLEWRIAHRTQELSHALEKERKLGELKSRFVTLISHEFRTPLTVIQSGTDLLKHYGDRYSPERRLEQLNQIQSQVSHMIGILEDYVTIARADDGNLQFSPVTTDLRKLAGEIVTELTNVYDRYELIFDVSERCPLAVVDPRLIRQIITNLVSNAVKYSPLGSRIGIGLVCRDVEFEIRVQDQGIGIPEADQAQLFDLFFRASNVGTIPGTGVGLPIIKRAVDAHKGHISVVSSLGQGSTFTVTLPLKDAEERGSES